VERGRAAEGDSAVQGLVEALMELTDAAWSCRVGWVGGRALDTRAKWLSCARSASEDTVGTLDSRRVPSW